MSPIPDLDSLIVPVRNAKQLLASALEEGMQADEVLHGAGLTVAALDEPGARISYRALIQAYENVADAGAELGLRRASTFNIADYGILGYAMMASPTLEHAINIALRYYRTRGPLFELAIEKRVAGEAIVQVKDQFNLDRRILVWVIEDLFGAFPQLLHLLLGRPVPIRRVEVTYPAPPHAERYREVFGCPVIFAAQKNQFVFDDALLGSELARADADSAPLFERSCRELLAEIERTSSLANDIRQRLLTVPGRPAEASEMAAVLNLGLRTLRRRLRAEGTSYQHILDEVRSSLAIDYLTTTDLTTQEIGELLGFTEATNFRRAFIRWTTRTPKSFRVSP